MRLARLRVRLRRLPMFVPSVVWPNTITLWRVRLFARAYEGRGWYHFWLGKLYIFGPWPRLRSEPRDD